jgi:hypothetical protein
MCKACKSIRVCDVVEVRIGSQRLRAGHKGIVIGVDGRSLGIEVVFPDGKRCNYSEAQLIHVGAAIGSGPRGVTPGALAAVLAMAVSCGDDLDVA